MTWYRELAGDRKFTCAGCGRVKRVKYVPTSNFCRRCAAEIAGDKRSLDSTTPIEVGNELIITKSVERRLRKKAEAEIPHTGAQKIDDVLRFIYLPFWLSAYFVIGYFVDSNLLTVYSGWWLLSIFGWCMLIPYAIDSAVGTITGRSRKERMDRIASRVAELAEERQQELEESARFYSSPEWASLRRQVIVEEGRICAECGWRIGRVENITVDHKRPRSKYPTLSLCRENLQVLCRRCNAKKGAKD